MHTDTHQCCMYVTSLKAAVSHVKAWNVTVHYQTCFLLLDIIASNLSVNKFFVLDVKVGDRKWADLTVWWSAPHLYTLQYVNLALPSSEYTVSVSPVSLSVQSAAFLTYLITYCYCTAVGRLCNVDSEDSRGLATNHGRWELCTNCSGSRASGNEMSAAGLLSEPG